jgi:hypothetical protein
LNSKGVNFIAHPENVYVRIDAVSEDLYEDLIDLIQPSSSPPA